MPGIRQRSKGSWEVSVFVGRDENGKRIRVWETVKGTKADALRRQREILSGMDRGIVQVKTKYRLGEWLDKWIPLQSSPSLGTIFSIRAGSLLGIGINKSKNNEINPDLPDFRRTISQCRTPYCLTVQHQTGTAPGF